MFLFLRSSQNVFPPTEVQVGRSRIADAFVVAAVIVELDEVGQRRTQALRARAVYQLV